MSAILSADDLNDFISPSVACIKPVETLPLVKSLSESEPHEVSFNTEFPPTDLPPAQISLTDCLACSGCVTSAEAVLVSLQSHAEVLRELDSAPALRLIRNTAGSSLIVDEDNGGRIYIASISPQSRASIAATYGVTERQAGHMIEQLLTGPKGIKSRAVYRNGFHWVVDTNIAREACLVLGADEVLGSTPENEDENQTRKSLEQPRTPILTSSCPGWICYAEKTHPHILPHLSRLKSPQALMGTLLKTTLSRKLNISADRIWHVAVMPCYDKKLEASREELTDTAWDGDSSRGVRDVDCVITSKELLLLAESRRVDFEALPRMVTSTQRLPFPDPTLDAFLFPVNGILNKTFDRKAGTSGGNLHYILKHVASRHEGASIDIVRGRNADVLECTVISPSGELLFKAARYYGFRNIQNLVRRLKPAKLSRIPGGRPMGVTKRPVGKAGGLDYSYIEVMACPGGCTNGGGQIKMDDPAVIARSNKSIPGPPGQKEWLAQVDEAYFSGDERIEGSMSQSTPMDTVDGTSSSRVRSALEHWARTVDVNLERLAYTTYRAVISDVGKKPETERVIEIAGRIGGGW